MPCKAVCVENAGGCIESNTCLHKLLLGRGLVHCGGGSGAQGCWLVMSFALCVAPWSTARVQAWSSA